MNKFLKILPVSIILFSSFAFGLTEKNIEIKLSKNNIDVLDITETLQPQSKINYIGGFTSESLASEGIRKFKISISDLNTKLKIKYYINNESKELVFPKEKIKTGIYILANNETSLKIYLSDNIK